MTRRDILLLATSAIAALQRGVSGQAGTPTTIDPDFVRAWDDAARARPRELASRASLVGPQEPGSALTVNGQIFTAAGLRPLAGATVFAYHTDAAGHYNHAGQPGWRLGGWARADHEGRFVFDTIHPGPYPGRSVAAHIHMGLDGPVGHRQTLEDVLFEGDALLTDAQRQRSRGAGRFRNIVPVITRQNRGQCDIIFRLTGEYVF